MERKRIGKEKEKFKRKGKGEKRERKRRGKERQKWKSIELKVLGSQSWTFLSLVFFEKSKKVFFFSLFADFLTCTIS